MVYINGSIINTSWYVCVFLHHLLVEHPPRQHCCGQAPRAFEPPPQELQLRDIRSHPVLIRQPKVVVDGIGNVGIIEHGREGLEIELLAVLFEHPHPFHVQGLEGEPLANPLADLPTALSAAAAAAGDAAPEVINATLAHDPGVQELTAVCRCGAHHHREGVMALIHGMNLVAFGACVDTTWHVAVGELHSDFEDITLDGVPRQKLDEWDVINYGDRLAGGCGRSLERLLDS